MATVKTKTPAKPKKASAKRATAAKKEPARKTTGKSQKKNESSSDDLASTYNRFKEFEGRQYTGMKVWPQPQMVLRPGRVEGEKTHARSVANPLRRHQAPCRESAGGIGCSGGDRIQLVHPRTPKCQEAKCERLLDGDDGDQIQARS